ncbi:ankyrin repeat and protein kinase domain-containing protein [Aspergillus puulaauensis]|uniref:Protein kinase domain-containing protein n=1 Tax=Aspergillus puulaauensis TaxID=1220207 RepID=A0A7R8AHL9_9EURO|nr:uncharacterized protein APUU_12024S [Aspergillus puulaauensis]BCS19196.1 hypothetical protein APUU_12024S [Aspergillus puulaauensis]
MWIPWPRDKSVNISTLRMELQNAMVQSNSDPKAPPFVPRWKLKELWDDRRLKAFADRYKAFKLDHIERIKTSYLQTLSILVEIQWNEWRRFQTVFLMEENRSDEDIPGYNMNMLMDPTFLGGSARDFLVQRPFYYPIDIEEGRHRELDEGWILPVIKSEVCGNGGAATVTKEHIHPGHLRYSDGRSGPCYIARKRFTRHTSIKDFATEKNILETLRTQLRRKENDGIMPFFATITMGNQFNLFFEWADSDLEHLLREQSSGIKFGDLLGESKRLAGALEYLQYELDLGLRLVHMDLKPANILVFKGPNLSSAGHWKISDFGESILNKPPINVSGETFRYPIGHNLTGTYRSPQLANNLSFGRKSDVWSLGCILVRVLAFGLDGENKLKDLDERRGKNIDGESDHGHNYFHRGKDHLIRNPHIEAWLNELPNRDSLVPSHVLTLFRDLLLGTLEIDEEARLTSADVKGQIRRIQEELHTVPLPDSLAPMPPPTPPSPPRAQLESSDIIKRILKCEDDTQELQNQLRAEFNIEEPVEMNGYTDRLLIHAIRSQFTNIVDELLKTRPDIDKEGFDSGYMTPLSRAIATKSHGMVIIRRLLQAKVNINAVSATGLTPLMVATRFGHLDVVRELLYQDADYLATSSEGCMCLHHVAWAPKEGAALIKEFTRNDRIPVDIPSSQSNETPLIMLIKEYLPRRSRRSQLEWRAKFDAFIEAKADLSKEDKNGMSPLYHAVHSNLPQVINALLSQKARMGSKYPQIEDPTWAPDEPTKRLIEKNIELQPPPRIRL